jgi:hypothetical protein
MNILRVLTAGASFLLCVVLGAAGGAWGSILIVTNSNNQALVRYVLQASVRFWAGAGAAVGVFLGALVAFQVWSVLGRRSRESRD